MKRNDLSKLRFGCYRKRKPDDIDTGTIESDTKQESKSQEEIHNSGKITETTEPPTKKQKVPSRTPCIRRQQQQQDTVKCTADKEKQKTLPHARKYRHTGNITKKCRDVMRKCKSQLTSQNTYAEEQHIKNRDDFEMRKHITNSKCSFSEQKQPMHKLHTRESKHDDTTVSDKDQHFIQTVHPRTADASPALCTTTATTRVSDKSSAGKPHNETERRYRHLSEREIEEEFHKMGQFMIVDCSNGKRNVIGGRDQGMIIRKREDEGESMTPGTYPKLGMTRRIGTNTSDSLYREDDDGSEFSDMMKTRIIKNTSDPKILESIALDIGLPAPSDSKVLCIESPVDQSTCTHTSHGHHHIQTKLILPPTRAQTVPSGVDIPTINPQTQNTNSTNSFQQIDDNVSSSSSIGQVALVDRDGYHDTKRELVRVRRDTNPDKDKNQGTIVRWIGGTDVVLKAAAAAIVVPDIHRPKIVNTKHVCGPECSYNRAVDVVGYDGCKATEYRMESSGSGIRIRGGQRPDPDEVWICSESGNIHVCNEDNCDSREIDSSGYVVCSKTKNVFHRVCMPTAKSYFQSGAHPSADVVRHLDKEYMSEVLYSENTCETPEERTTTHDDSGGSISSTANKIVRSFSEQRCHSDQSPAFTLQQKPKRRVRQRSDRNRSRRYDVCGNPGAIRVRDSVTGYTDEVSRGVIDVHIERWKYWIHVGTDKGEAFHIASVLSSINRTVELLNLFHGADCIERTVSGIINGHAMENHTFNAIYASIPPMLRQMIEIMASGLRKIIEITALIVISLPAMTENKEPPSLERSVTIIDDYACMVWKGWTLALRSPISSGPTRDTEKHLTVGTSPYSERTLSSYVIGPTKVSDAQTNTIGSLSTIATETLSRYSVEKDTESVGIQSSNDKRNPRNRRGKKWSVETKIKPFTLGILYQACNGYVIEPHLDRGDAFRDGTGETALSALALAYGITTVEMEKRFSIEHSVIFLSYDQYMDTKLIQPNKVGLKGSSVIDGISLASVTVSEGMTLVKDCFSSIVDWSVKLLIRDVCSGTVDVMEAVAAFDRRAKLFLLRI